MDVNIYKKANEIQKITSEKEYSLCFILKISLGDSTSVQLIIFYGRHGSL